MLARLIERLGDTLWKAAIVLMLQSHSGYFHMAKVATGFVMAIKPSVFKAQRSRFLGQGQELDPCCSNFLASFGD